MLFRGHKNGFNRRVHCAVHPDQLKLVLKVRDRTQSAQNDIGIALPHEVNQQAVERANFYVFQICQHFSRQGHTPFGRDVGSFLAINPHRNDHMIKQACCPFDQVGMTVGDGIECAGVNCCFHSDADSVSTLSLQYTSHAPLSA